MIVSHFSAENFGPVVHGDIGITDGSPAARLLIVEHGDTLTKVTSSLQLDQICSCQTILFRFYDGVKVQFKTVQKTTQLNFILLGK